MKLHYQYSVIILFFLPYFCNAQQSKIDSLETVIARNSRDVDMANALNKISGLYNKSDTEKAKTYAWQAKILSKSIGNTKTLSSAYSLLVNIHKNTSQQDSTDFYLEALKNLATTTTGADSNFINQIYYATTGLYYKTKGKTKEALTFLLKAYDYTKKIGNNEELYGQAINIGNCYYQFSDYKKSLEYYFVALKGFESLNNKAGQSYCYNNISNCYYDLNRFTESITYLKKSAIIKKELGDKRGLATTEGNLGNNYMGLGDFETAKKHFEKAIRLHQELNNQSGLIENYYNIARMYPETDPQTALLYFKKSRDLAIKNKDSFMLAKNDVEILATKAIYEKQLQSENSVLLNVETFKEAGKIKDESEGYKSLAEYYTQNKQFDKALEYNKKYHLLRDSIKSNDVLAQFKTIEEAYNKEKNEKHIALLQKDQLISAQKMRQQQSWMIIFGLLIVLAGFGIWMLINRNRTRQQLKELQLRNGIAADLHDEVGSSLSSIYMLSQMAGTSNFDAQGTILDKVKVNAKETMEKMRDIVWMIKPIDNNLESLKDRMKHFLQEICTLKGVVFDFKTEDLDDKKFTVHQKKNIYLIFKEAVHNAIKYSNTKKLDIKISQHRKQMHMSIEDYGDGFEIETIKKGNGLENMNARAKELKGTLTINSKEGQGTKIDLSFPLS